MAPNVKHWHATAADSWFVHLTIEGDVTAGPSVWMELVTDEENNKLQ
ncbi:hypothetical protein ACWF7H_23545 [Peribacillus butanolivorans]